MKTKAELRTEYNAKRQALSIDDWKEASQKIFGQFVLNIDLSQVNTIHTFLPIQAKKEPDTWPIIKYVWEHCPQVKVVASQTRWQTRQLKHYYLLADGEIAENRWGIPEPLNAPACPNVSFDLVLVPLLAFDGMGNRLGYGGGFYDRFLAQGKAGSQHIGVSLFPALPYNLPELHQYDLAMSNCLTPDKFYKFPSST